jgi:KaiC/GvpD/RAD55 family RecA-like ATPase
MQVILKHELQHEQARAVLDSIRETNSFLTVSAMDRDISLNR